MLPIVLKKPFLTIKDLSDQPLRLRECCHGPAWFNKPGSGILFEWNSNELKKNIRIMSVLLQTSLIKSSKSILSIRTKYQ